MSKKRYTEEFKREAVSLVRDGGKSANQVAKDIGVAQATLSKWVRDSRGTGKVSANATTATEEENARLRRELRQVKQERDFLKSAAAYFAKEQK